MLGLFQNITTGVQKKFQMYKLDGVVRTIANLMIFTITVVPSGARLQPLQKALIGVGHRHKFDQSLHGALRFSTS